MGTYYEGGAVIAHKARLLIACGGRGGREHPPWPTYNQMHAGFSFSYSPISVLLRQPLSIKKSYAGAVQYCTEKRHGIDYILVHINKRRVKIRPSELSGHAVEKSF